LVIEVESPSNTPRQLRELAALCLSGKSIPLEAFGGSALSVTDIFL
jgi:hypothetical protein